MAEPRYPKTMLYLKPKHSDEFSLLHEIDPEDRESAPKEDPNPTLPGIRRIPPAHRDYVTRDELQAKET
jgi:hypothetical protein